jgi:peroxiredoxin
MFSQFQEKGISEIWCTSVNDQFVMGQWWRNLKVQNINFLPDGNGQIARRMGMLVKKENLGFGYRSWRYAVVINNGEVEKLFAEAGIEDDHGEDPYQMSKPETVLKYL